MSGRVLADRYRLDVVLGRGGMGTVWRGYDLRLDRAVAVKELRLGAWLSDEEAAEVTAMAVAEARRSARLVHPHIVTTFDVVDEGGKPWLVMQLVVGRSLGQVIAAQGRLPVSGVARIGAQVLSGIVAAHVVGVVHRDVKPANILIADGDGAALLSDFSIATVVREGAGGATAGTMVGSAGFVAPELLLTGRVGPEGDLFGLGACLFEAVEGYGAFAREQSIAGLFASASSPHPAMRHAGDLAPVIDGLLVKDPAQRMRAPEALAALTAIASGDVAPLAGGTPSPVPDTIIRPRRATSPKPAVATPSGNAPGIHDLPTQHRGQPPVGSATSQPPPRGAPRIGRRTALTAIVVAAAGAAAYGIDKLSKDLTTASPQNRGAAESAIESAGPGGGQPNSPISATPSPSPSAAPPTATGPTTSGPTATPSQTSKTQTPTPHAPTPTRTPKPTYSTIATLHGHTNVVYSVAFSPDRKTLASGSADGSIRLWNVATHAAIATIPGPQTRTVLSVAYSPDGRTLASANGGFDMTVRLWDVASRAAIATLTGHTDQVASVAFSPDGTTLASGSYDRTARLWDVASRSAIATLHGHTDNVWSVDFSPDGRTLATAGGDDDTVRLWDVASQATTATLSSQDGTVTSAVFSPDGRTIASGAGDGTVRLWNVATHASSTVAGGTSGVFSVAYGPGGGALASANDDRTIVLWNMTTDPTFVLLTGHTGAVQSVAFSPDGKILASASVDHTIRLWDVG